MTGPSSGPGAPGRKTARAKTRNVARRDVDPARRVAFETLRTVQAEDAYANLVLPKLLRQNGLRGRDAAFATEIGYGALRGLGTYDEIVAACVDRPLEDVDPDVLDALRVGAHQLFAMRVPAHAAVDATVDLVRAEIGQGAAGFANAVLRRMTQHDLDGWLDEVAGPDSGLDEDGRLAVVRSHPVWVVRALRDALRYHGRDLADLDALLAADNARPAVTLAALPGLVDVEALRAAAAAEQDEATDLRPYLSPVAVRVDGQPGDLPAVRSGAARVQDEGSQLVALALAAAPLDGAVAGGADGGGDGGGDGGRWLDLCAGPGGKSALLGATMAARVAAGELPPDARLVANEAAPHRAELVRSSVAGVEAAAPGTVVVRTGDGRVVDEADEGRFDRVLVDAPCTGLGALRRRPEARWRRSPQDLAGLAPLQRDLLTAALRAVRPGGVVAYVTCSPHPAETGLVVDDVLRRRDDVERLDAREVLSGVAAAPLDTLGPGPAAQLWPDVHGTDAMYLALLRRRA